MRDVIAAALVALTLACEDRSYRDIGADIAVLTKRSDAFVAPAIERLRGHGRSALPQIETALHTASDRGRRNLVAALAAIGDAEAIPILRHFALYDLSPEIRVACEELLVAWSSGPDPRAGEARTARARLAELRAKGEGPAPPRPGL